MEINKDIKKNGDRLWVYSWKDIKDKKEGKP